MWEDIALYANCSNICDSDIRLIGVHTRPHVEYRLTAMNAEDGANPKKSTHEAERRYEVRPDLGGF